MPCAILVSPPHRACGTVMRCDLVYGDRCEDAGALNAGSALPCPTSKPLGRARMKRNRIGMIGLAALAVALVASIDAFRGG